MRQFFFLPLLFCLLYIHPLSAQGVSLKGSVTESSGEAIAYATIILKSAQDSSLVKADITDDLGHFTLENISQGRYFLEATFIGLSNYISDVFEVKSDPIQIPQIILSENAREIEEVVVTATRSLIEVKADRMVFNVQGTINATGDNGLSLLRKAPGVLVDNNNSISVLGRAGVLLYVDGKRIPLSGDDLTSYLENLSSDQIDKIDIITNPGSKYEAQGNAGIIDIRLKKDKNQGYNGSVGATFGHGRYGQGNVNASGNYRNKRLNTFGGVGYNKGTRWNELIFENYQNGLFMDESNISLADYNGINGRWGTDIFLSKKSTLGFLVSAQANDNQRRSDNITFISTQATPEKTDSILSAPNTSTSDRTQFTYNINYAYESGKNTLNIDADYGTFRNEADFNQPNIYYAPDRETVVSRNITRYTTPVKIDITTLKADFETELFGGKAGTGVKYSNVATDNGFYFYNIPDITPIINNRRSNIFKYNENVYAAYINYSKVLNPKWNFSAGLRAEHTDATGDLTAFLPELEEAPAEFNYTNLFPSAGLTYSINPANVFSLNYGRRINRPDYNVLNPFKEQLSELSYSKGNKSLQPEIVNNVELGYTLQYRYTFKLAYSFTSNQITRLIGPDPEDPRAGFISWDNLAQQILYNFSASVPVDITPWWNAYANININYTINQADYGNNVVVDVKAGNYNIYQQHTFTLGKGWKGEISGWYSGPGVWGGVFLFDPSYSLNLGVQRKILKNKMNIRLFANDITFQSGWSGVSDFNGLRGIGQGNWDSRRVSLSISYDLGNSNVKSRKRNTGIEDESRRVGS
jgi:iron complex outermembrane recepter protein